MYSGYRIHPERTTAVTVNSIDAVSGMLFQRPVVFCSLVISNFREIIKLVNCTNITTLTDRDYEIVA